MWQVVINIYGERHHISLQRGFGYPFRKLLNVICNLVVDASQNLQGVQQRGIGFICIQQKESVCDKQNVTASKHISHGDSRIRVTLLNEWGYY